MAFILGSKNTSKTGVATEGLPSSRTCVDISVRRVWRTSTRGAAKPWKPSGMGNFCRVHEETIETCAFFSLGDHNFADKTTPVLGSVFGTPKWSPFIQSQFDLLVSGRLGPRFGVQKRTPKRGSFCRQNFCRRAKNSASFDCLRGYTTGFAYRWVSMILQRHEQLFATPCKHVCPHMLLNWGGPLWRDRFLLWFLDPKLVPTKITFFPFLEGAKSWENQ